LKPRGHKEGRASFPTQSQYNVSRSIPLILEKRGRKKRVRNTHGRGRGGAWEGFAGSVQAHGEKEG